jgi:hypothetical protein
VRSSSRTGTETAGAQACSKKEEPNTSCADLPIQVTVETPGRGPEDLVLAGAWGFHPNGHVQDCAADGKVVAVVTAMTVELYDADKGTTVVVDGSAGGGRVAVGHGWVAWSDLERVVHAARF